MALQDKLDEELKHIDAAIVEACIQGLAPDDKQDVSPDTDTEDAAAGTSGQYTSASPGR